MAEVDRSLPVVDSYIHMYDLTRFKYGWLQEPGLEGHTSLLGDYRMIRSTVGRPERVFREFYGANVEKCVHVEADFPGDDPVAETAWLTEVVAAHGRPDAIVATCDLESEEVGDVLDRHLATSERVRGIRPRSHPAEPSQAFLRGYAALAQRGLSYELNATPGSLLAGCIVAERYPEVPIVVGHAGFPLKRDQGYLAVWREEMAKLATYPNVSCRLAGFAMVDHAWTQASLTPMVMTCVEAFGADRVMFGSNWPVDMLRSTYLEYSDTFRSVLVEAGLTRDEQADILSRNAERFFRI